jgi:hypothetical protein
MKVFCFILAALFFASAAVQFNDPDPFVWISIYGATAVIALFAAFDKYNPWIILILMAACVYEAYQFFPGFTTWVSDGMPSITGSMQAESPYIEMVREFLGVVITLSALIFFYVRARRKQLAEAEEKPRF